MTLFNQQYHAASNRLSTWDYTSAGYYFITICTHQMNCFFGNIINKQMILSSTGKIIADELIKTKQVRKNVDLDQWVIMPNHLHAIIVIKNMNNAEMTRRVISAPTLMTNSLGSIISQFKSICTKRIRALKTINRVVPTSIWQSNYYDHIIRNEKSLHKIRQYIQNNPAQWEMDEYNKK